MKILFILVALFALCACNGQTETKRPQASKDTHYLSTHFKTMTIQSKVSDKTLGQVARIFPSL